MLDIYSWAWGLVCIPSERLLEKTKFSFVASYQLETTSELGMGVGAQVIFNLILWYLVKKLKTSSFKDFYL